MLHSIRILALSLIIGLLLGACSSDSGSVDHSNHNTGAVQAQDGNSIQTQTVDGLTIALDAPATPRLLQTAVLSVTLSDSEQKPVEGADVYFDLTMPEMPMGSNKPVASEEEPGVYSAQALFNMTGKWHVTVHIDHNGTTTEALFELQVVEAK
jgi:nitrogen fixation protein FixH